MSAIFKVFHLWGCHVLQAVTPLTDGYGLTDTVSYVINMRNKSALLFVFMFAFMSACYLCCLLVFSPFDAIWKNSMSSSLALCNALRFTCRLSSILSVSGTLHWLPQEERVRKNSRPLTFAEIFLNDWRVTDYEVGVLRWPKCLVLPSETGAGWGGGGWGWVEVREKQARWAEKARLITLAFPSQISHGMSSHLPPWSWPSGER